MAIYFTDIHTYLYSPICVNISMCVKKWGPSVKHVFFLLILYKYKCLQTYLHTFTHNCLPLQRNHMICEATLLVWLAAAYLSQPPATQQTQLINMIYKIHLYIHIYISVAAYPLSVYRSPGFSPIKLVSRCHPLSNMLLVFAYVAAVRFLYTTW